MSRKVFFLIIIVCVISFLSCIIYRAYGDNYYEITRKKDIEIVLESGKIIIKPRVGAGMRHVTNTGLNIGFVMEIINKSSSNLKLDMLSLRNSIKFRDAVIDPPIIKRGKTLSYKYYDRVVEEHRYIHLLPDEKEKIYSGFGALLFEGDINFPFNYKKYVRQYKSVVACEEVQVVLKDFIIVEYKTISIDTLRFRGNIECPEEF